MISPMHHLPVASVMQQIVQLADGDLARHQRGAVPDQAEGVEGFVLQPEQQQVFEVIAQAVVLVGGQEFGQRQRVTFQGVQPGAVVIKQRLPESVIKDAHRVDAVRQMPQQGRGGQHPGQVADIGVTPEA